MRWWWCKKTWFIAAIRVRNENFHTKFRIYNSLHVSRLFHSEKSCPLSHCECLHIYNFIIFVDLFSSFLISQFDSTLFLPANFVTTTTKADSSVLCINVCMTMDINVNEKMWARKKRERCCALMRTSLDSHIYLLYAVCRVVVKQSEWESEPADDLIYSLRIENLSTSVRVECYADVLKVKKFHIYR